MDTPEAKEISWNGEEWIDKVGNIVEPAYNSMIDTEICDRGWEEELLRHFLKPEPFPGGGSLVRCVRDTSRPSGYIHIRGFNPDRKQARRRKRR